MPVLNRPFQLMLLEMILSLLLEIIIMIMVGMPLELILELPLLDWEHFLSWGSFCCQSLYNI